MAIRFKLVPRKNPQDETAAPKYYAQVVTIEKVNLKDLAELVTSHTTMSGPDVYGVIMALEGEIKTALKSGRAVELGDLCIMYPALDSDGADTEEDFSSTSHITRKKVRIRAKRGLSKTMSDVSVERISS